MTLTLDDFFVGWDATVNDLVQRVRSTHSNFPPYNIAVLEDKTILIELALAGYNKEDIEISVHDGVLSISSKGVDKNDTKRYTVRGIAKRKFLSKFVLNKNYEVKDASMENGLLVVKVVEIVPEKEAIKLININ